MISREIKKQKKKKMVVVCAVEHLFSIIAFVAQFFKIKFANVSEMRRLQTRNESETNGFNRFESIFWRFENIKTCRGQVLQPTFAFIVFKKRNEPCRYTTNCGFKVNDAYEPQILRQDCCERLFRATRARIFQ